MKETIDLHEELRGPNDKGSWQCVVGKSFGAAVSFERSFCILVHILSTGQYVCLCLVIGVTWL